MKKLMFVAALASAMATYGDVSSANIVGYMNTDANTGTKPVWKMMCPSFLSIGQDGCYLTDMKFTGYQDYSTYKTGGFTGSYLTTLNSDATASATYTFMDTCVNGEWVGGYWYHNETKKKIVKEVVDPETEEADTLLPAGTGLWCYIQRRGNAGTKIQLVSAGEVLAKSKAITCNTGTKPVWKSIGNPMARAVDVTELKFDGYQDYTTYKTGGFTGSYLTKLNSDATAAATYTFMDTCVNGQWVGGYWYHNETKKKIVKEVTDPETEESGVTIEPGEALWCYIQRRGNAGTQINLVWPKL